MKKIDGYESVEAAETKDFAKPVAGGYVCMIIAVDDVPLDEKTGKGDYLKIAFDFAEGELSGYYSDLQSKFGGKWSNSATTIRSYKASSVKFFKAFTQAVEKSNPGYRWNFDERTLVGKWIGVVMGEEEYIGNDGSVKTRLKCESIRSVDAIRSGNFTVPEKKRLPQSAVLDSVSSVPASEDIPFFV